MMTVLAGLNLDTALASQPGMAAGMDAGVAAGFVDILASLDPVSVAAPAPVDAVAPMLAGTVSVVPTIEPATDELATDAADAGKPIDQPIDTIVVPPFVAPPIAIGVTSAAPIVAPHAVVAEQNRPVAISVGAPQVSTIPLATAPELSMPTEAGVADIPAGADIVPPKGQAQRPDPLTALLAPLVEARETVVAPAKAASLVSIATAMLEGSDPRIEMPVIPVQSAPTAVPLLSPPPPLAVADMATAVDTAPDTARQLGEQAVAARLDIANEAQMIDRLARDIAQLSSHEGRLRFQLNPEHLGTLHVEVEQRAEGVSLRFGTETEGARQVIADAQHRLVSEARAQGMRIAETHVDLGSQYQQGNGRDQQARQPIVITRGDAPEVNVEPNSAPRGGADRFA